MRITNSGTQQSWVVQITNYKIISVAIMFAILLIPAFVFSEEIKNFKVEIKVANDSSLYVAENILYDFGFTQRHGIYRTIPVKYERSGANYNVRFNLVNVDNGSGESYKYKKSSEGRYVKIKIGDADKYVSGQKIYSIKYKVQRAINYFEKQDELYWNVTGNEWEIPINNAVAVVYLPSGIAASKIKDYTCYTGSYGSNEKNCSSEISGNSLIFRAKNLKYGEGLTLVVGFPKGVLQPPSSSQNLIWFFQDNWYFIIPILTFIFMLMLYLKSGRDPDIQMSVKPEYQAPEGLTPAEAGTVLDEKLDLIDITASLIDLAVRGYLKIKELPTEKFLFLSSKDYSFTLLKQFESDNNLKDFEKKILKGIFGSKNIGESITLSSLKEKFYTRLEGIKSAIYKEVVKNKKYFNSDPRDTIELYLALGFVIIFVSFFIFAVKAILAVNILISGIIMAAFAKFLPAKTKEGVKVLKEILGLKEFIIAAEKDKLETLKLYEKDVFEKCLPYALVFGVADKWAESFKDIYSTPPSWYDSPAYAGAFSTHLFVNDLGRSVNSMGLTFVSTPPSSGGRGGSSGFSSGGGFSGGGFGGGGGGSW